MNLPVPEPGDLGLVHHNDRHDMLAKGIMWFTHGVVSHAFCYVGHGLVVEALADGIGVHKFSKYMVPDCQLVIRRPNGTNNHQIAHAMLDLIDDRYGYSDILADLLYLSAGRLHLHNLQQLIGKSYQGMKGHMDCSAACTYGFAATYGYLPCPRAINLTTPEDLLKSRYYTTIYNGLEEHK